MSTRLCVFTHALILSNGYFIGTVHPVQTLNLHTIKGWTGTVPIYWETKGKGRRAPTCRPALRPVYMVIFAATLNAIFAF